MAGRALLRAIRAPSMAAATRPPASRCCSVKFLPDLSGPCVPGLPISPALLVDGRGPWFVRGLLGRTRRVLRDHAPRGLGRVRLTTRRAGTTTSTAPSSPTVTPSDPTKPSTTERREMRTSPVCELVTHRSASERGSRPRLLWPTARRREQECEVVRGRLRLAMASGLAQKQFAATDPQGDAKAPESGLLCCLSQVVQRVVGYCLIKGLASARPFALAQGGPRQRRPGGLGVAPDK